MVFLQIFLLTLVAYAIGAIPSSVWWSKLYYGIDIRDHGSGSASHRNVNRVLGRRSSWLVRVIDFFKGLLAVRLAFLAQNYYHWFEGTEVYLLMMTIGLAAVMGHIFPVFAGFRGGKGYHVSLGVMLAINPLATLCCVLITGLIFVVFRYPNLGYIAGGLALPVFIISTRALFDPGLYLPTLIFSLCLAAALLLTHRQNLIQIFRGKDERVRGQLIRI